MIEKISSVKFARLNPNPTEYQTKPMSGFMLSKAMITQKPIDPKPKENQQKPMSWVYAFKSDDDSKNRKNNILAYAVKSDDGQRPNTLKPGTNCKRFFTGRVTPQKNDPQNLLRLVLKNATSTCNEKPFAVEVSFLRQF